MKKLIKLSVLMFVLVLVIGCTNNNNDDGDNDDNGETAVTLNESIEIPEDAVAHLFEVMDDNSEYDIVLTDLLTGNDLAGITLEEDDISIFGVLNFENGYHGALVGVENPLFSEDFDFMDEDDEFWDDEDDEFWDDEDDEFWDDEDDEFWDDGDDEFWDDEDDEFWDDEDDEFWDDEDDELWDDEGDEFWDDGDDEFWDDEFLADHDENLRYLIFDSELNIIHDILITDPYLLVSWDHFITHVILDNNELIVYYAPDLFHLADEAPHSVRRYNATTGETVEIAILEDADLFIENIVVIGEDTIAFAALNIEEAESDLYYGTIDIASGNITMLTEAEFVHSGLTAARNYVLLNQEILTSLEMDEDGVYETPEHRNMALLLDAETNESREVQLGEGESMWARLSLDASYIVTVTSDFSSFRQYDIRNGEMVFEVEFDLDHGEEQEPWAVEIYAITDSTYVVHFLSELGMRTVELVELP